MRLRFYLTVVWAITACSTPEYPTSSWPCPCIDGYVCHPEAGECVPVIAVGCDTPDTACASDTNTGDACPAEGAYLPCVEGDDQCIFGCRTCDSDLHWSDCSVGLCEDLGTVPRCSTCRDDCGTRDRVGQVSCDTSAVPAVCVIESCLDGYSDVDEDQATGCEHTCQPTEVCNGIDDDCNGVDDDNATDCITYYRDEDGDDVGVTGDSVCTCAAVDPYRATVDGDCDDDAVSCASDCTTDVDIDVIPDCRDDCTDQDFDGLGIGNLANAGCVDATVDVDDTDPTRCADTDFDTCDDCVSTSFDAGDDGADFDSDGLCDAGDDDDDDDSVLDTDDTDRFDPHVCQDLDADNCDDCAVTGGPPAVANDGYDADSDGACERGVVGEARLVYAEATTGEVQTRRWDATLASWNPATLATTAARSVRWLRNAVSTKRFEELIGMQMTDGAVVDVTVLRWHGSAWVEDWTTSAIDPANADERGFDLAYEAVSGDALAVYNDGTTNPAYRIWDGTTWSAAAPVFVAPMGVAVPAWVQLVPRPESNEIALVYADAQSDVHAVVWDGDAWDLNTADTLSFTLSTLSESKSFDAAYEWLGGDLVVVIGHVFGGEGDTRIAVKPAASPIWSITNRDDIQRAKVVDVAAERGTDRMVAVLSEGIGDDDVTTMNWDGDDWSFVRQDVEGTASDIDQDAAVAWVGTTGMAVAVYRDGDGAGKIDWVRKGRGEWWSLQTDVPVVGMGELVDVELEELPGQDAILALIVDDLGQLVSAVYDGTDWTVGTPTPLSSDLALGGMSFAVHGEPALVLGESITGQVGDAFVDGGAANDAPLFAFRLAVTQASPITVAGLTFALRDIVGLGDSDWAGVELVTNDGSQTVVGTGVLTTASATIAFDSLLLRVDHSIELLLRADFASLDAGDRVTISLDRSDIGTVNDPPVFGHLSAAHHHEGGTVPLVAGEARVVFGTGDAAAPRMVTWDPATTTWSAPQAPVAATKVIQWMVGDVIPGASDELVAVLSRDGATSSLDLLHFDGSAWTVDWSSAAIPGSNALQRGFDLALEALSGDAMVVYSVDTDNAVFRTWDGSSWSSPVNVFAFAPSTGVPRFIELVERPGSDELTLLYATSEETLNTGLWTGQAWDAGSATNLSATMSTVTQSQAFAAAYEDLSGDLVAVWGHQSVDETGATFGVRLAGQTAWTIDTLPDATRGIVVRLAAEPFSDRVAGVLTEGYGDDDLGVILWDGELWRSVIDDFDGTASGKARDVGIAWVGTSGHVIVTYTDSDGLGTLNSAEWTQPSGWRIRSDVMTPATTYMANVALEPIAGENGFAAVMTDVDAGDTISNVSLAVYDDVTGWAPVDGGAPIAFDLSSLITEPMTFYSRAPPSLRLLNTRSGQVPDAFSGAGGESDAELFAFSLGPRQGPSVSVSQLTITIIEVQGLTNGDWTGVELVVDDDGDGTIGGGETTVLASGGVVDQAARTITFTSSFDLTAPTDIILRADFTSLAGGDQVTLVLTGDRVVTSALVEGATTAASHVQAPIVPPPADDVRLTFAGSGSRHVRLRTWDATTATWSAQETAPATMAPVRWIRHEVTGATEMLAVLSQSVASDDSRLELMRWDGATWSVDWGHALTAAQGDQRGFDLAVEGASGDVLAVYFDGTENPVFRTWNGTLWSGESPVFTVTPGIGVVDWLELTPHPSTDEVTLFYVDDTGSLYSVVWDGVAWDEPTAVQVSPTMSTTAESRAFDAVYENVSGDLVAVWGHEAFAEDTVETGERAASTGVWTTAIFTDAVRSKVVRLAAEPGSDRVAAALTEGVGDDDVGGMIWDGSAWGSRLEWDGTGTESDRDVGVAWLGTTGTAIVVYADAGVTGAINSWRWTAGGGWQVGADVPFGGSGQLVAVEMVSLAGSDRILAVISDIDARGIGAGLYAAIFDGSWSSSNNGQPLAIDPVSLRSQPFDVTIGE